MKNLLSCLVLAFCILPMPLYAAEKTFPSFTVDVPDNWIVRQENLVSTFVDPQHRCGLSIATEDLQGGSLREIALMLIHNMQGSALETKDEGFEFSFTTPTGAVNNKVRVTQQGDDFFIVTVSGICADMEKILPTIKPQAAGPRVYPQYQAATPTPQKNSKR